MVGVTQDRLSLLEVIIMQLQKAYLNRIQENINTQVYVMAGVTSVISFKFVLKLLTKYYVHDQMHICNTNSESEPN